VHHEIDSALAISGILSPGLISLHVCMHTSCLNTRLSCSPSRKSSTTGLNETEVPFRKQASMTPQAPRWNVNPPAQLPLILSPIRTRTIHWRFRVPASHLHQIRTPFRPIKINDLIGRHQSDILDMLDLRAIAQVH
jgi:hypothetical protein